MSKRRISIRSLAVSCWTLLACASAGAANTPNILVIFGDDVGILNVSAYGRGVIGLPDSEHRSDRARGCSLHRLLRSAELYGGAIRVHHRARCRFAPVCRRSDCPARPQGLQKQDPTIADLLKPAGYATGQFGKNHLGDRDEFLPTAHGFDEFFGNLYHLNAEEEPENEDYPKSPEFRKNFGPRGVIHSWAQADGTQKIEDTGPLTKQRMETVDDEFLGAAIDFMNRSKQAGKPFFVWFNTTRMHNFTHVRKEHRTSGLGEYADGMIEHDAQIGRLLEAVDQGGFAANTIVIYTSDNGPMVCLWPDAGETPFRGEKNTNWEGGWRVPALIRWPGTIQPGTVINDIFAGEDWLPTLLAAAGVPGVKEKLLSGYKAGKTSFKVHLDGYDQTELLAGKGPGKRKEFFYFSDDGDLLAVRHDRLKVHFMVQNATGIDVWRKPFETLRAPIFFDLRSDPTERGQDGMGYDDWWYRHAFYAIPIQKMVGQFLATFQEFPPRQKPGSFTVGDALSALSQASGSR